LTEDTVSTHNIAFIGGGNMARSLIGGLVADGYPAQNIWVTDPAKERLAELAAEFGVHISGDNAEAAQQADAVVLAVKPQVIKPVAEELGPVVKARRALVISIAAGVREGDLARWLGGEVAIVRSMPNTPALVQTGATALYANPRVSPAQRDLAESLLRAAGITQWLQDEQLMDAVTAVSGSGPAYFFLLMELMQEAGVKLGLPAETARMLTLQTALGAAKMALESREDAAVLRQRVTSPGGTTERALTVFAEGGIHDLVEKALRAATERAGELGDILGSG
jgi:pyrroline-5-carboxylate reductase